MILWLASAFASGVAVIGSPNAAPSFERSTQDFLHLDTGIQGVHQPRHDPSIWQGQVAAGQYPSTVAIFAASNQYWGGTFCSGTVIHPNWVLTAAHCVVGMEEYTNQGLAIFVGVGDKDVDNQGGVGFDIYAQVTASSHHPSYQEHGQAGSGYDIGLLYISNAISASDAPPIPLYTGDASNISLLTQLRFVGFGITSDELQNSGVKRTTALPFIRYTSDMLYSFNGSLSSYPQSLGSGYGYGYTVAAWDSTSNICSGDSGGSTYIRVNGQLTLVGVNAIGWGGGGSSTASCAHGGAGSTRVDAYLNYINTTLAAKGDVLPNGGNQQGGDTGNGPVEDTGQDEPKGHNNPNLPDYKIDKPSPEGPIDVPSDLSSAMRPHGCAHTPLGSGKSAWLLSILGVSWLRRRRRVRQAQN